MGGCGFRGYFSTLVVFVVALLSHSSLVSLLTIALAGAILGFLRFNFNPATIFLGDLREPFYWFHAERAGGAGSAEGTHYCCGCYSRSLVLAYLFLKQLFP